jgi:hypothetical protein
MGETLSKAGVLFGDATDQVVEFAEGAATSLGQSKQAALDASATFATFGKAAGLTGTELATFSTELTALASDIGSFQNAAPGEVVEALGAALRGEAEPMRRFGVLLDDATMRQKALEMGIIDTVKNALTPQQKILAAQALIFEQTADAQGDFARTSDSLANQQRILSAEMENVRAELGQALLPVMKQLAGIALDLLGVFNSLPPSVQQVTGVVGIAGGAFLSASKTLQGLGMAAGKANKALGAIGLLVGGAVAIYGLYNSEKQKTQQITSDLADALEAEAEGHKDVVAETLATILTTDRMNELLSATGTNVADVAKAIRGEGVLSFEALGQGIHDVSNLSIDNYQHIRLLREEYGENFGAVRALTFEVDRLAAIYGNAEEQVARNARVTDELTSEQRALDERLAAGKEEAARYALEIEEMRAAMEAQTEATREAEQALLDLQNQTLAMFNADLALENQIAKTEEAILEYALGIADGTLKGRDLEAAMRDVRSEALRQAEAALEAAEAQAELDGKTLSAAEQQRILRSELAEVAMALDPSDPLRAQLQGYISELGAIPPSVRTEITTVRREIVEQMVIAAEMGVVPGIGRGATSIRRNIGGPIPGPSGLPVPVMAHGGEYVLSADVVDAIKRGKPSRGLDAVGGGAGGGGGNVINITVTSADPQAVVEAIRRYNRSNGPAPIKVA